ncbi:hypothetical protein [Streptomyces sp. NPDC018610]|uniref:hypothetical protein n=1 Tax=Streptomyces sp. NPDC018610 TaxID=3365049 RepID=UPI00378C2770
MLVSLTRVGPTRHSLLTSAVVAGVDAGAVVRSVRLPPAPAFAPTAEVRPHDTVPGLLTLRLDGAWLGTPASRAQVFGHLAEVNAGLARVARAYGGVLLPAGVQRDAAGPHAPLAGDRHGLHILDDVEQAVLVNLLRRHSPTLIALTGRARVGGAADRAGSRRLIESREHLTTRFLPSADARYLHRFQAELRRTDGISDLSRMDVVPVPRTVDGPAQVLVRCVDAQAALADTRAQALLLDALVLRARRMAADGRRERHVPQDVIDVNRTRAVVHGLRARFLPTGPREGKRPAKETGTRGPAATAAAEVSARQAGRRLLRDLLPELSLLDATALELLPLLAPLDLPDLGLRDLRTQDLLRRAARDRTGLAARAEQGLCDPRPGAAVHDELERTSPGRLRLLLDDWGRMLAAGAAPADITEDTRGADAPDSADRRAAAPRRSGARPGRDEGRPRQRPTRGGGRRDRDPKHPGGNPGERAGRKDPQ